MKRFLTLLLCIMLLGSVVGCKKEEATGTAAPDSTQTAADATPSAEATPLPTEPASFASKSEELEWRLNITMGTAPVVEYCPEYNPVGYPNIKAIWFTGPKYGEKDTKVFAYIGFPAGASAEKPVPAVVLMHGGGGYAFPNWVKLWNDRGYAAIAVGNTGYFPAKEGITDFYNKSSWTRRIPSQVKEKDPRVVAPDNDNVGPVKSNLNKQWLYHAVSQACIANNILRADERVDKNKVGITGISWGSVITSITIGYDTRFAFAVPVYAGGYLNECYSWIKNNFAAADKQELWGAENRFDKAKMPVLFISGDADPAFSINSLDKSFAAVEKGVLSVQHGLIHGHAEGWNPPEIYRFADSVVNTGSNGLITPKEQPTKEMGKNVSFALNVPDDAESVKITAYYITAPMSYSVSSAMEQTWTACEGTYEDDKANITLPQDAVMYYVQLTAKIGIKDYKTSSRLVLLG